MTESWLQRERAREILSKEVGYVRKPHGGRLRVALTFPNTYFVGMSNLGFQTVYTLFNAQNDIVCERVFLPPKTELAAQLASGAPLVTLESQTPVRDFDIFAFSVSFEWDYTNVLTMLRLAGMAPRASDRTHHDPLVMIGGAVTFVNPEPLAPFADVVAAGEGEALIPPLLEAFRSADHRDDFLRQLVSKRGFYVPAFYDVTYADDGTIDAFSPREGTGAPPVVRKAALKTTDAVDPPATTIFTPDTEFGSRLLIEVVRGCANLCRFCWAGYNYLPVRAFPKERILQHAAAARPHSSRIGLVSIALCDHPDIEEILSRLVEMGYSISPASLRLDDLTPTILRLLRESGERTVTIAPETGSDRLRRVINKTITNDEIIAAADLIFENGFENLKLYFMSVPPLPDSFEWTTESWGLGLRCRALLPFAAHVFTTRQMAFTSPDDERDVSLAIGAESLALARQVHGRKAIVVRGGTAVPANRPEADALVSNSAIVAVAVRVADCVPLLIADRRHTVVAAVHAGWRGTAARVAVAAVEAMSREFGSQPADLIAAIGPSIGACCYEVGTELVDAFAAAGHERYLIDRWFLAPPPRRGSHERATLRLDVVGANRDQLVLAGVPEEQIHLSGLCTAMHLDVFTSYRAEKEKAGRLVAAIRAKS